MANDYNNFCLIGRLTRDCQLKYTNNGTPVVDFSIAVNKQIDKDNNYVNFFDMVIWGKFATAIENYLKKGQQVQVAGEIKQERWQDKNINNNRSRIKFVVYKLQLIGGKNNNNQDDQKQFNDPYQNDDDMPF